MAKYATTGRFLARKCPTAKSSHRRCSIKKDVLKFRKFTEKHLCWSLFFNKVPGLGVAILLKRDSNTGVFPGNLRSF